MTLADLRFARLESALAAALHNGHLNGCEVCGYIPEEKGRSGATVYCHYGQRLRDAADQKRGALNALAKEAGEDPPPSELESPKKSRRRS